MYGLALNDPDIDEKLKDKKIVVPKENSRLYQYAKNSEAIEKWIVDNYDRIKNGEKPLNDWIEFPLGGLKGAFNDEQRGLFATIHRANMRDIKLNSDGSITGRIDDKRIDIDAFPKRALFEGVINAVAHRDYYLDGTQVQIDMFKDRLEISSPGGFYRGEKFGKTGL